MLEVVVVCPHPPALVPELAQGAAGDLADLRSVCDEAVGSLVEAGPERIVVAASGPQYAEWSPEGLPDFEPYGLRAATPGTRPREQPGSPTTALGLSIGAWLLDRQVPAVPRTYLATAGGPLSPDAERTALLVMADGTAKRAFDAPGYFDDRAEGYDADIAKALATGDAAALERLDAELGAELWIGGVPAFHTLGATVRAQTGSAWTSSVLYDAAPYGVGYLVAIWRLAQTCSETSTAEVSASSASNTCGASPG